MIKPSFFSNVELGELSPLHRILFAGLWCWADREGRLEDKPKQIKHNILPFDDCDVNQLLIDLEGSEFISRYSADNMCFIQIVNFEKHQHVHPKEAPSEIPPCNYMAGPEISEPTRPSSVSTSTSTDTSTSQQSVPASQEEPNEQPLEFRDMLHRYVRRKGLKKPTKPVLDRAELAWQETAVDDAVCDAALDGFHENDWWKTAKEPLLGFVKDPRSWISPSWKRDAAQRVIGFAKVVPMPTAAADAPEAAQIDFPGRWNELVPSKPVRWDTKRSAIDALLHAALDEVFVERFDEMCEVAQAIHERCGAEAGWVTFEFAIRRTEKGYGWWRILTEFRDMKPRRTYPESGQTDDKDAPWRHGGKFRNQAEIAQFIAEKQAEAELEEAG